MLEEKTIQKYRKDKDVKDCPIQYKLYLEAASKEFPLVQYAL